MNNKVLLDKFRKEFIKTLFVTVVIVTLVEIVAYMFFALKGKCTFSIFDEYLRFRVWLPIVLNWFILFVEVAIEKYAKLDYNTKNRLAIIGAMSISFVTTAVHREYIVIMAAFMFPLLFCATFNDRKLFDLAAMLSFIVLLFTAVLIWFDGVKDLTTYVNIMLMFYFLVIAYIGGHITIDFSQRSFELIYNQEVANAHLRNIVLRDSMTGLYNHRTFYAELDFSIRDFTENNNGFCLAMIDIDDFKKVNDTYGHDSGDAVLKKLAEVMSKHCSKEDRACRYGGEEFAIIFNKKHIKQAESHMRDILKEFAETVYDFTDKTITFSCGVAFYQNGISREDFFNMADSRMYFAKKNGKNQIVTSNV